MNNMGANRYGFWEKLCNHYH